MSTNMDREEHIRKRQEAIALKRQRREKQKAFEASRVKVVPVQWHYYPDYDPVEMVKHRMSLVAEGKKIYAHDDERYALVD